MDRANIGDTDVYYQLLGQGKPLVLIMGLTANMDWWDPEFLGAMSDDHRLLIFDNRGAGRTPAPPGDLSIRLFADDTAGLMDAVGFGEADVLGISMGGMIAQELALNYPEKVDRLVLCATFCGGQESLYADKEVLMKMADRSGTPEQQVKKTISLLFPEEWLEKHGEEYYDDFFDRYSRAPATEENALRQFMATATFSTHDRLPQIENPTLVMCGTEDIVIPSENSKIIADRIEGAKLVEFEGAGHGFINQCRDEVQKELAGFIG